ncbi:cilia- and flagella-associated protein 69-like isoform X1 [Vespula squamosa]|uniref:Cilia- and flagella-associated protein 69-like isoform X1 n=1 Tax=Vespula squamosa TaxID=30214 RepID=A0ABD1ZYJ9_VESSQ
MEGKKYQDEEQEVPCEKTIKCSCPGSTRFGKEKCREIHVDYVVHKLHELISDPATKDDVSRISRLLYDYQEQLCDRAYMVKHLPMVIKIIEFLETNAEHVEDYRLHLDQMLEFSNRPPLLEKFSENITCSDIMEQYFTFFGYLLTILERKQELLKVHEALRSLLIRTVPADPSAVKPEICRAAMEKSDLSLTVAGILNTSSLEKYPMVLELIFLLSSISCVCCHQMLQAGILDTLLIRMDLSYATQMLCKPSPNNLLKGDDYSDDTMSLIMNILWTLMRSILPSKKVPVCFKDFDVPVLCAIWGIRYAFNKQIYKSQNCTFNAKLRNEIALLILLILQLFPPYMIISSGIAYDVLYLLSDCLSGTIHIWSKNIKFLPSKENLVLLKTLLLIVSDLATFKPSIHIMTEMNILLSIFGFINLNSKSVWSPPQFWHLFEYAIFTLIVLAPKLPMEFVKHDGTEKLMSILKWCCSKELNLKFTMISTKAVCSIVLSKNPILLQNFRERQMVFLFFDVINCILCNDKLTIEHQRILTILFISANEIIREDADLQLLYGYYNIKITQKLLNKYVYHRKDDDFHMDQRLLLAIGSYIWGCIVPCLTHLKNFVNENMVYTIIDVIDTTSSPVRCLFLGLLTDICENIFCGHYLCTWRGVDKDKGFISLLAMIWREEEREIGVRKQLDGSIADTELPQMGWKQWLWTYHKKLRHDVSPAMIDTIGSSRSKIYALRQIIEKYGEQYQMARDHYKILINDLSVEDKITMSTVNLYFRLKLGQTWIEISKYLAQLGVTPLGMDGELMFLMSQRYHSWGLFIQKRQRKLNVAAKRLEGIEEKEEYARIRDTLLAPTFDALDEIEYIRRTTDRSYMLRKKNIQNGQVNTYLNFPSTADIIQCHRTFQDNVNVTAVFDQHLHFIDKLTPDSDIDLTLPSPISPEDLSLYMDPSIYDVSFSEDLSCEENSSFEISAVE